MVDSCSTGQQSALCPRCSVAVDITRLQEISVFVELCKQFIHVNMCVWVIRNRTFCCAAEICGCSTAALLLLLALLVLSLLLLLLHPDRRSPPSLMLERLERTGRSASIIAAGCNATAVRACTRCRRCHRTARSCRRLGRHN